MENSPTPSVEEKKRKGRPFTPRVACDRCKGCKSPPCGSCEACLGAGGGGGCKDQACLRPVTAAAKRRSLEPKGDKKQLRQGRLSNKMEVRSEPCGKCDNCRAEACGACEGCLEDGAEQCRARRCTVPSVTVKTEEESNNNNNAGKAGRPGRKRKGEADAARGSTSSANKRTKRCGECAGCTSGYCGACYNCNINTTFGDKDLLIAKLPCITNKCTEPVPIVLDAARPRGGACKECPGCRQTSDCGSCEPCKGNPKFGGSDVPPRTCQLRVCQNNPRQGNIMIQLMMEQDDGVEDCKPVRIVDGVPYDLRCFFCKKLPRFGCANRSELYRHYSIYHYANEIKKEFGDVSTCPICHYNLTNQNVITHLGQRHNAVEKYLPGKARIPDKLSKTSSGGRARRARAKRSHENLWGLPDVFKQKRPGRRPINFDDRIFDGVFFASTDEDGYTMEFVVDDSPTECVGLAEEECPDYNGHAANCSICKENFEDIKNAVYHIHNAHNIAVS